MGPALVVRPAQPTDLGALAAVEHEVFADEPYPAFFFRQALDVFGPLLLVAEGPEGGVAGYTLGALAAGSTEGWILSLGVRPAQRGQGIATRLTEEVVTLLFERGAEAVRLTVDPENRPAVALYERLGFAERGGEADYFGGGHPRLVMEKRAP